MIGAWWVTVALAGGSADLAPAVALLPQTDLHVDVRDPDNERIIWFGDDDVDIEVFRPDGSRVGVFSRAAAIKPDEIGAYRVQLSGKVTDWVLRVEGAPDGRVWATDWRIEAPGFGEADALDITWYARVPDGDGDAVIAARARGLAGYVFRFVGRQEALPGTDFGSLPEGRRLPGDVPLYLAVPEVTPDRSDPDWTDRQRVYDDADCGVVVPGELGATLQATATRAGTWHLVCDTSGDGIPDLTDPADLHRWGTTDGGPVTAVWDGLGPDGAPSPPGDRTCRMWLAAAELHLVAVDVETLYPGLRTFDVTGGPADDGMAMFWDDAAVADAARDLPGGEPPLLAAGANGLRSGLPEREATANVNARAWGAFRAGSRGTDAWLDTMTWRSAVRWDVVVTVLDPEGDRDGDGLLDALEACRYGTDADLADTDGDGLDDGVEVASGAADPLVADTDGDCLGDAAEVRPDGTAPDTDRDGVPDVRDDDDDDDLLPTCVELEAGGTGDLDGDGRPDHLDFDADGDGYSDGREGTGDLDLDGRPDFLDPDTVGLGITAGPPEIAGGCRTAPGVPWGVVLGALVAMRRRQS